MSKISPEDLIEMFTNTEVRKSLLSVFENFCAVSDLKLLRRISELEDKVADLEERNQELEDKLKTKIEKASNELPVTVTPSNITDIRTDHLVDYIESNTEVPVTDSGIVNLKIKCMNSKVFKNFVTTGLPESLRPKSFKNLRKLKKDLFENAATRYKDKVSIDKAFYGNKETRLMVVKEVPLLSVT